jgi:hypothetical protein
VKDLHATVQQHIKKKNEEYPYKTNNGRKFVRFEPED